MKLELSENNPNARETWEETFSEHWEKNAGQEQSRRFAECFHKHIKVPFSGRFSVLDVGCAIGDALPVWHKYFPEAELAGTDVSQVAVGKAKQLYGQIARFSRASFEEIEGSYDIIFCSNVLEHFEQHVSIARELMKHCSILYVMTPYAELDPLGRHLHAATDAMHVATFLEDTFAELEKEGLVSIDTKIVRCPIAWSPSLKSEVLWHMRYLMGLISPPSPPRRQIIYTMKRKRT